MNEYSSTPSLIASLIPFLMTSIPFIILNAMISERKGKSGLKNGLLSIIPFVGFCITFYLLSFMDKETEDKINAIYQEMKKEKSI